MGRYLLFHSPAVLSLSSAVIPRRPSGFPARFYAALGMPALFVSVKLRKNTYITTSSCRFFKLIFIKLVIHFVYNGYLHDTNQLFNFMQRLLVRGVLSSFSFPQFLGIDHKKKVENMSVKYLQTKYPYPPLSTSLS